MKTDLNPAEQRDDESLAEYDERRADEREEALQQIQHIASEGMLTIGHALKPHAMRSVKDARIRELEAKIERIKVIAESGGPDEDWRPITRDGERGDRTIVYGAGPNSRCRFCHELDGGATHCPHCGAYNRSEAVRSSCPTGATTR